ncbi:hypothetical protein PPYR_04239 [Photinus pyralis]|uniref:Major facilitator superfamily (MFS) profile domain-containing protein n=1 Tax=Photinus pyralis TaxID=7054 RepID=A0A1Y1KD00_PHOPY|nr:monocarboxylate transporter 5 [Photinus pyralis]XP_031333560.1 monocarboxylate transporter 5 [Photinus pyralis]KAB0802053.1 hypothetical protein PPYR_04239 [Photinus pyralis]
MSPNGVSNGEENGYLPISKTETENNTQLPTESNENSESLDSDEQSDDAEIVVPPDGGWGWVVVIASFLCNMVVDGIVYAFGMFLEDISKEFDVSEAKVSLVGSLLSGFYLMVGPFTSALANRYGFRLVAIVGSVLSAIVFGLSYFATDIIYLCVVYGIIGGIGFGLIYVPAVITVGFYFEKFRALATGIAVCGSGAGTFVFAPLCAALIKTIGWRCTIIAQALMILTCILFASTFRPVKPTKLKNLKNKDEQEKPELVMDSSKLNPNTRMKMETALANMKAVSSHSLNENQATIPKMLGVSNNAAYPTAAQVWKTDKVYHTISVPHRGAQVYKDKRPSIPFITITKEKEREDEQTTGTTPLLDQDDGLKPIVMTNRRHTMGERRPKLADGSDLVRRRGTLTVHDNRPLYRDDIFFGASLTRLPQYTSQSSLAYNLSVTRPPTKHEIEEEAEEECRFCPESIRRPLATMLDISLLKSISFLILATSGLLTMLGFFVPFVYSKHRAVINGMDEHKAIWLISTLGIANTIGRVVSGMISSFPKVNVLLVNNVAISIGGIATILSGLSQSTEYQYAYAIIFGLSMSCFASLRPILVVDLVGLDRLTNAFGIILLFQGVAACAGAPMAGEFFKVTGSYDASFYLSGSLILASAVICYPLGIISRWEKRKLGITEEKSVAV